MRDRLSITYFLKPRMKLFYLPLLLTFLFIIGCSANRNIMDYNSQAEFYKDINNSIKDRNVRVVTADSSFISFTGSEIKYDSLQVVSKIPGEIPGNEIKDITNIKYYGIPGEGPSASLLLKNGRELRTENLKIMPDSTVMFTNMVYGSISLNKVKNISYKTRWQSALAGIPAGFLCGALIGGISGATGIFPHISTGGNEPLIFDPGTSGIVGAFWGAIIGTVTGAIMGTIIGWQHIFQFNH